MKKETKMRRTKMFFHLIATLSLGNGDNPETELSQPPCAGSGYLDLQAAVNSTTPDSANTGIQVSQMLSTGENPVSWVSVVWNSSTWDD